MCVRACACMCVRMSVSFDIGVSISCVYIILRTYIIRLHLYANTYLRIFMNLCIFACHYRLLCKYGHIYARICARINLSYTQKCFFVISSLFYWEQALDNDPRLSYYVYCWIQFGTESWSLLRNSYYLQRGIWCKREKAVLIVRLYVVDIEALILGWITSIQ